jgi:hypothetical protein
VCKRAHASPGCVNQNAQTSVALRGVLYMRILPRRLAFLYHIAGGMSREIVCISCPPQGDANSARSRAGYTPQALGQPLRRRVILWIVSPVSIYFPSSVLRAGSVAYPFLAGALGRLPVPRSAIKGENHRAGAPLCLMSIPAEWHFVVKRACKWVQLRRCFSSKSVDTIAARTYHAHLTTEIEVGSSNAMDRVWERAPQRGIMRSGPRARGGLAALDEHHRHIECRVCRAERWKRRVLSTRGDSRRERCFY